MVRYKFSRTQNKEFATVLRQRVNAYFQDQEISQKGNTLMAVKTLTAYLLTFGPFILALAMGIESFPILLVLFMISGFGKGFIGTSVMHDALHGSYSNNKIISTLINISPLSIGVYPKNWKIQHNVLHHMYTNVEHADEDISPPGILRFSPFQDHKSFHKFQHIYVMFFYSIFTMFWIVLKDYLRIVKYKNDGVIKKEELPMHLVQITLLKIVYLLVFIGLPIMILPIPVWQVLVLFVAMHLITGTFLSLIFQLAHVMPTSEYIEQEDLHIDENWFVHQLQTTSNFGMDDKVLSWFAGGLNYQVEHHLFPHICHMHYPAISKIVQQTTQEFGIPYYAEKSVWSAIGSHFRMLKMLGNNEFFATQQIQQKEVVAA
ncbi:MAG: acyl-CoA desaturase [Bacteroidota bacterium]